MMSTTSERTTYNCPAWCIRDDHAADDIGPGYPAMHYGPSYGAVSTQSDNFTAEAMIWFGEVSVIVADPGELRATAAGMIEAAAWIEAQQWPRPRRKRVQHPRRYY